MHPPCLSRRALLGAGGLTLTLTACGGVPSVEGAGPGDPITALADVPEEGALDIEVDGRRVLVVRTGEDAVVAWDAECPHQGCRVRALVGGGLGCPCHGSEFAPDTGDVLAGPATTGLTPLAVSVRGADVVLG
ncbi:Rieske (2Fe-2S) protein [Modestobacter sp. Leaf380]|uniref:Rieske (2Fe-2S) protein n=1 Tax=Modestobacter sp. Leaf380 TaxID=1736356 RepID=UPI0006FB1776|nr:Rieske (2Fe-2S) protein [Modestobacter sp. Leaf380]KQS68562.1 hypothetical protein ASG41_06305 [Modestobacter sp. Leaf380]